jgi:hypothetical protein
MYFASLNPARFEIGARLLCKKANINQTNVNVNFIRDE